MKKTLLAVILLSTSFLLSSCGNLCGSPCASYTSYSSNCCNSNPCGSYGSAYSVGSGYNARWYSSYYNTW